MTDYHDIEQYVADLLELVGVTAADETEEGQALRACLHPLYCAVSRFALMDAERQQLVRRMQKRLNYFFAVSCNLKERKRKREKKNLPPHPPIKEKARKEKDKETLSLAVGGFSAPSSDLERRREAFRQECMKRLPNYDAQQVADFFNYWADDDPKTGKMRFEAQRFFNIDRRLPKWVKNQYSAANVAAAIRLRRARKQAAADSDAAAQQQAIAEQRQQSDAEREAAIEAARAGAVSFEEWKRRKEK